jgi:hypothetical protein
MRFNIIFFFVVESVFSCGAASRRSYICFLLIVFASSLAFFFSIIIEFLMMKVNNKEGSGTMKLSNGDSFQGSWRQGLLDGPVVYKFADNSPWNDPEY